MLSALLIIPLLTQTDLSVYKLTWEQAVERIAPHVSGFQVITNDLEGSKKRFEDAIKRAGIYTYIYDSSKPKKYGYFLETEYGLVNVGGKSKGIAVLLVRGYSCDEFYNYESALVLFLTQGGKVVPEVVEVFAESFYESYLPENAVITNDKLFVSGLDYWRGNGPRAAVYVYKQSKNGWRKTDSIHANYESWGTSGLKLSKSGKTIQPVRVISRAYPKNMNASHADAQLSYEEQWSFPNGIPKLDWKNERDTPFNALDKLYFAITKGDEKFIRRYSSNENIAKQLISLKKNARIGYSFIEFPDSICWADSKIIGLQDLDVWFYFERKNNRWVVSRLKPLSEKP
jgi:hypothetical protein